MCVEGGCGREKEKMETQSDKYFAEFLDTTKCAGRWHYKTTENKDCSIATSRGGLLEEYLPLPLLQICHDYLPYGNYFLVTFPNDKNLIFAGKTMGKNPKDFLSPETPFVELNVFDKEIKVASMGETYMIGTLNIYPPITTYLCTTSIFTCCDKSLVLRTKTCYLCLQCGNLDCFLVRGTSKAAETDSLLIDVIFKQH